MLKNNRRTAGAVALIIAIVVALLGFVVKSSASATTGDDECVPSEAWTETIEHPAVTEQVKVIDQEWQAAVWANFQPNNHKGPFVGPPTYPTDERGSWNVHDSIPPGHKGPNGVYAKGNPDKGGNWFYRQTAVPEKSHMETKVITPAWTETIEHDAVVCDDEPTCETDPTLCPPDPTCETDPTLCEPEVPAIKAESECISQTEVKVTTFEWRDGDWVDIGAKFYPAKASDHCKITKVDQPKDKPAPKAKNRVLTDSEVDVAAAETYSYEEGM